MPSSPFRPGSSRARQTRGSCKFAMPLVSCDSAYFSSLRRSPRPPRVHARRWKRVLSLTQVAKKERAFSCRSHAARLTDAYLRSYTPGANEVLAATDAGAARARGIQLCVRARAVHPRRLFRAGVEAGARARRGRRGAAWPASALLTAPARSRGTVASVSTGRRERPQAAALSRGTVEVRRAPPAARAPPRRLEAALCRESRQSTVAVATASHATLRYAAACAAARCRKPPLAGEASCANTDAIVVDSVTWRRRSPPPGLPSLAAAPVLGLEPRWSSRSAPRACCSAAPDRPVATRAGAGRPCAAACTEDVLPSSQRRAPPPYCQGCG